MAHFEIPSNWESVVLGADGPALVHVASSDSLEQESIAIRVSIAGVCRSDIREVARTRSRRSDFGHEIVGVVASSPHGSPLTPGSLVCVDPHVPIRRTPGFAEWMIVAGAADVVRQALPLLPSDVSRRRLVFTEPLACAHHCVAKIADHLQRDTLDGVRMAVIGAGSAGVLVALIARTLGAEAVIFNRSPERLEFLRTRRIFHNELLVALRAIPLDAWDVVVCAVAHLHTSILDTALAAARDEGLVLLFGGTAPGDVYHGVDTDFVRRRELLQRVAFVGRGVFFGGSYGATGGDVSSAVRLLSDDPALFPVERLIARTVSLPELPALLCAYSTGALPYIGKTILEFEPDYDDGERRE